MSRAEDELAGWGCGLILMVSAIAAVIVYWYVSIPVLATIAAILSYQPLTRKLQARSQRLQALIAEQQTQREQRLTEVTRDPLAEVERALAQQDNRDEQSLGRIHRSNLKAFEQRAQQHEKQAGETAEPNRAAKLRHKADRERAKAVKYRQDNLHQAEQPAPSPHQTDSERGADTALPAAPRQPDSQPPQRSRSRKPRTKRSRVAPDTLRYIRRRHDEGATLTAIAHELNAAGVPTARGGTARWWPTTIRNELNKMKPTP